MKLQELIMRARKNIPKGMHFGESGKILGNGDILVCNQFFLLDDDKEWYYKTKLHLVFNTSEIKTLSESEAQRLLNEIN